MRDDVFCQNISDLVRIADRNSKALMMLSIMMEVAPENQKGPIFSVIKALGGWND